MPSFRGKFVGNTFQWLFSLRKVPGFASPASLEAACDASVFVGQGRAVTPASQGLFVSLGSCPAVSARFLLAAGMLKAQARL